MNKVLLLISAVFVLFFIFASNTLPFRNKVFSLLFPKSASQASITFPNSPNMNAFVSNPGATLKGVLATNTGAYFGGFVNYVGPYTGAFLPVAASTGIPLSNNVKVDGLVYDAISDGFGGWYLAGRMIYRPSVNQPIALRSLMHILPNGTMDNSFNLSLDRDAYALALSPDKSVLYVGGSFKNIAGQPRNSLAAINTTTKSLTNLDANISGFNTATINTLALNSTGTVLYFGGFDFSSAGGLARNRLAAINTSTGAATSFLADVAGTGFVTVSSLVLSPNNSTLYVGGRYQSINGITKNNLASLNATTGNPNTFVANPGNLSNSASVSTLALSNDGNTLYVGGSFFTIGGQTRKNLAALNSTTGNATSFDPTPDGQIQKVAISPDQTTIYIGGTFTLLGNQPKLTVAALDTTGNLKNWGYSTNGSVKAFAFSPDNTTILVAGAFSSYSTAVQEKDFAFGENLDGTISAFNPLADNDVNVYVLSPNGNSLFMAGNFFTLAGFTRPGFAAVDPTTGALQTLSVDPDRDILAMAISPDSKTLYLGGSFHAINDQTRNGVAAVDLTNGTLSGFNPDVTGTVEALAVSPDGNTLYVGGAGITAVGGQPRVGFAAINTTTGVPSNVNLNLGPSSGEILSFSLNSDGSILYIGGNFTSIGGQSRTYLAAMSTATGIITNFSPNPDGRVLALALSNDNSTLFVGGDFYNIAGQARTNLASLDSSGALSSWNPLPIDFDGGIRSMSLSPDNLNLYVVGGFTGGLLRYTLSSLPSPSVTATSSPGISNPISPSPTASCPLRSLGDINCNGRVDIFDYNLIVTDFGKSDATSLRSDLNGNGRVDIFDYNIIVTNFGRTN